MLRTKDRQDRSGSTLSDFFSQRTTPGGTVIEPTALPSGWCILDPGLAHTALCASSLCQIEGEKENLLYRGVPIRTLLATWDHLDVAHLLMTGVEDPLKQAAFQRLCLDYLHRLRGLRSQLAADSFHGVHPVDFLMIAVTLAKTKFPLPDTNEDKKVSVLAFLLAAIAVAISVYVRPEAGNDATSSEPDKGDRPFLAAFLASAFGRHPDPVAIRLLNQFLIIHAEHGMNTSATVVRSVVSGGTDPFAAIVAGMAAFKGPLHGGASEIVGAMYDDMIRTNLSAEAYIDKAIASKKKIMGFGGRAHKFHEPRSVIMQSLIEQSKDDFAPIRRVADLSLQFSHESERRDYFQTRRLFPNPDLFNGVLVRRVGFPAHMNTMLLCFSRAVGWLCHYYESIDTRLPLVRAVDVPAG